MLPRPALMGEPQLPSGEPLWDVETACAYFARSGLPIKPDRLRKLIQGLDWAPDAEIRAEPGSKGGRGRALYKSSDMMIFHARLAEFVATRRIRRRPGK